MNCRTAERWLLESFDHALAPDRRAALLGHLGLCGRCREAAAEFVKVRGRLAGLAVPEPLPYFWERLERRLDEKPAVESAAAWVRWSLRAIPVSLSLIAGFLAASLVFLPVQSEVVQPEAFLLTEANPITEAPSIIDEPKRENRDVMILFAADERVPGRR
jgi:anti-sigma factor RsiW